MTAIPGVLASARTMQRSTGTLSAQALGRMEAQLDWFPTMSAAQRAGIGMVAQAGIAAFASWLERPDGDPEMTTEVFAVAPRTLARTVSLRQVVELIRVTVDAVEAEVPYLAAPGEEALLREAVLRFSREVAFAAAQVYARAAEERGAWDARQQALALDALLRGDPDQALASHAAALGWQPAQPVAVLVAAAPEGEPKAVLDAAVRLARDLDVLLLAGVHAERLVLAVGAAEPALAALRLAELLSCQRAVVGTEAAGLPGAIRSAREALAGFRALRGCLRVPPQAYAADLLPERALDGDEEAHQHLEDVHNALAAAGEPVLATAATYLDLGGSLEACARAMFLHPNTVRYRLRKAEAACGLSPTDPRDGFVLRVALTCGRLRDGNPL